MPIDYKVIHEHRLVMARGHGDLVGQDIWGYQEGVWSNKDVAGYDELMDMTDVERIVMATTDGVRELVSFAARMEPPKTLAKFAIVAPQDHAFGLARMFQAYRELDPRSTKQVAVFRSMQEALTFLGLASLP